MSPRETAGQVVRADSGSVGFYNYINLFVGDVLIFEGVNGETFTQEITELLVGHESADWVHNDEFGEVLMSVDQPVKKDSMIYVHTRGPNSGVGPWGSRLP